MKKISKVLAVALLAFVPTLAFADAAVCPANIGYNQPIGNNVTNTTGCNLGTNMQDSVAQVNADQMFGQSTWQKFGAANGTITGLGDTTGDGNFSGTLTLNVNWNTIGMLMLVFKDGNGEPNVYVGYLVQNGFNGVINWTTPFKNSNNGNPKNVSHINAYVIPATTQVPEPASLFLMGTGLLGAGRIVRKRFQK